MTKADEITRKLQTHKAQFTLFGLEHDTSTLLLFIFVILIIVGIATLTFFLIRLILLHFLKHTLKKAPPKWLELSYKHFVFHRLSHVGTGIVAYLCAPFMVISGFPYAKNLAEFIKSAAVIYIIAASTFTIYAILDCFSDQYRHFKFAKQRPIKSYIQVVKILLLILAAVLIISNILGQSPMYFLTGLGAMTAVLMLVFKDSILGFVASIQLAAYDMIHLGDWIELPNFGANGDVIDISLNTIKIQNFDKTIVTVPSYALLSHGVKNWRGMNDAGGRRIKRAIYIDAMMVKFCDPPLLDKLKKIPFMEQILEEKLQMNEKSQNQSTPESYCPLTNLSLFRYYLTAYLKHHIDIHPLMTMIVRQLSDEGQTGGIPLEIYAFTRDTDWFRYEEIQADIFDHIYAMIPFFDLQVFQPISGKQIEVKMQS